MHGEDRPVRLQLPVGSNPDQSFSIRDQGEELDISLRAKSSKASLSVANILAHHILRLQHAIDHLLALVDL